MTNVGAKSLKGALLKFGLEDIFDTVITRNDVELMKPSGEGIKKALEQLRAKTSSALFIGDSITDIMAARDAEIKVAIVQGGESDFTSLIESCPDYIWRSLREIMDFLF